MVAGSPERQLWRITAAARIFVLVTLAVPVLWYRETGELLGLIAVGAIWSNLLLLERISRVRRFAPVLDAALTGLVCGLASHSISTVIVAVAVPPFVAATRGGARALVVSLVVEVAGLLAGATLWASGIEPGQVPSMITWVIAGLGLGMIGTFLHSTSAAPVVDDLAPYHDAQRLIRQLLDLSDDLRSGLDVTSLAGIVLSEVRDRIPTSELVIYVPRGEVLVPLVTKSTSGPTPSDLGETEELAVESWARSEPIVYERSFAFPLGESAIVGGTLAPDTVLDEQHLESEIIEMLHELRGNAVQLDTALLFSDFRDAASADVRKRLAREMHDGIAQDIASLGYLVDALAARPSDDTQAEQLAMVRGRITKIVAEVRQSVLTLRTSIGEAQSLGAAISSVARHLSEASRVPIQVTLDEHSTRLRSEVEAELFRITQEAMNNAIKHAQCTSIEVNCQVYAPDALITVTDDGRGLQEARSDSHGLKIMRERARLVGAELTIDNLPEGGLRVSVQLSSRTPRPPRDSPAQPDRRERVKR